ncbi:hypothetical protein [Synechococcus phage Ssp-JY38]|nr:hypothetical protein [Synechococcus phage Yong-L2-223]
MNPFKYRPDDDQGTEAEDSVDWEDNWLSNAMAWVAHTVMPRWCSTPGHWTSKFANYLWTDCPCCLIFRGIVIGLIIGIALGAII